MIASTPAADGMFAAVKDLSSSRAREKVVRAWLDACPDADAAAYRRLVEADKKRRQRANVPLAKIGASGQCPAGLEENDGTLSPQTPSGQRDISPQVPPVPPPPPASSPTPTSAYVRPTVEQVVASMNANTGCRIPPQERREVAQAYLDARNRTEPPWWLPATHDRPARPVGVDWQADCRIFCRNWQEVLHEKRAREQQRGGHRPRAEPDTTPLSVDAALWQRFITSSRYPEYHNLTKRPVPSTEADISPGVLPDWHHWKRQNSTSPNR